MLPTVVTKLDFEEVFKVNLSLEELNILSMKDETFSNSVESMFWNCIKHN